MSSPDAPAAPPGVAAAQHVMALGAGYMVSCALHAAAALDVASQLLAGPRPVDELAAALAANEDALYRCVRLGCATVRAGLR
jgi:hypothetical protein